MTDQRMAATSPRDQQLNVLGQLLNLEQYEPHFVQYLFLKLEVDGTAVRRYIATWRRYCPTANLTQSSEAQQKKLRSFLVYYSHKKKEHR
jgi:hypothetical protein